MVEEFDVSSSALAPDDGPRVFEKNDSICGSVDGGSGGDDGDYDIDMPLKKLSVRKNTGNRKTGCKEDSCKVDVNGENSRVGSESGKRSSSDVLGSISQRTRNRVVKGRNVEQNDSDDEEHGFCVGDFVWGKIKSHPWWPGRIYDPSNASDFAMKYKHEEGRLLVAYFGDRTFAWCDPSQLKPFEENFEEMSVQSSLKSFVYAVEEAVDEFCCLIEMHTSSVLPLVVNAGIKEGVRVSLDGVENFSDFHFEPTRMLAEIQNYARTVSVTNVLELKVLKSRLSALYHAKGGYSLPVYYEPLGFEEPVVGKDCVSREGLTRGSDEANWCASPRDLSVAQTGPETPDGKLRRRRKEKTMAELLEMDTKVDGSKEETQSGKVASKSEKKKRRLVCDDQIDGHELKMRRVVDKNQSPPVVENSRSTRSSARKKYETERKKSSSDKEDGCAEIDQKKKTILAKDRKLSVSLGLENGVTAEEIHGRISPREKKRSKYLSPPYTSPLPKQKSLGSVGGSLEFSDVTTSTTRVGERMSIAAGKLVGDSHAVVKCHSLVKSIRSSDEVLCKMRVAALDPLKPRKGKSFDTIRGFLSSYRSANYKDGSDNELGISSAAALVITFPEEYPLPTKKDVMEMHSKFGDLDESKTEVVPKSSSAKIVFLNSSDAEAAMDSMLKRSPFGTAKVSYEIQHLTTAAAATSKGKKRKLSLDKHTPGSPENEPLAVIFIKQKLAAMKSMLAQTDGKMSEETKSNLESDVKELLKKVKMMTASSSPPS